VTNVTRLQLSPEVEQRLKREREAIALAEMRRRSAEIDEFLTRYPPVSTRTLLPPICWEEVQRQLEELAWTRQTRSLVQPLLEGLRAKMAWQPPEMVARGLILLAGLVMDEYYDLAEFLEPEPDNGEAPMP
jgi:hypothetical protein